MVICRDVTLWRLYDNDIRRISTCHTKRGILKISEIPRFFLLINNMNIAM